jgi:phenylalanyl-tRNA synthetase alpha chain
MASETELRLLRLLEKKSLQEAGRELGLGDGTYSAAQGLAKEGLVKLSESRDEIISLGDEGMLYAKEGLPEARALERVKKGPVPVSEFDKETPIVVMWLKKKGWAGIENGKLVITEAGKKADKGKDQELLELLAGGNKKRSELRDYEDAIELLSRRQGNIEIREIKLIEAELTPKGRELLKKPASGDSGISSLTHEMLKSGSWKGKKFREYGIREAEGVWPAKLHPLKIAVEKIRRIFLEMGFNEARGNFVESAFWNFDALFQPQDHPAREMADTFYIEDIKHDLPSQHTQVKGMHEDGGGIGSRGWQYKWDPKVAMQSVLRTHTTAVSARSLRNAEIPSKTFSIGRVFRNETLDYKHLAEFHQVEGIVIGEDVNFRNLLWYLKEFYNKLGFKKVRFRPAYFPYTEMSCEPEVYFEEKKEWVELGGSGIFRPEVVKPLLGKDVPVLAWGLGLERPLMLKMGLDDLRTFYKNDLDWLRSFNIREVL